VVLCWEARICMIGKLFSIVRRISIICLKMGLSILLELTLRR
jgi:hypothetical protein